MANRSESKVFYMKFSRMLEERGITAYRFAKDTGILESTVSAWKRKGNMPKAKTLRLVADYFGVSMDEMMKGV